MSESQVLEQLLHIRAQMNRVEERLEDVTGRLAAVERHTGSLVTEMMDVRTKLDHPDGCLARIERLLELREEVG